MQNSRGSATSVVLWSRLSGLLVGNRVPCPGISKLGRSRIIDHGARIYMRLIKKRLARFEPFLMEEVFEGLTHTAGSLIFTHSAIFQKS
jgi:hypothetical protein